MKGGTTRVRGVLTKLVKSEEPAIEQWACFWSLVRSVFPAILYVPAFFSGLLEARSNSILTFSLDDMYIHIQHCFKTFKHRRAEASVC